MLEKIKDKLKFNIGRKSLILIAACAALVVVDLVTKIFEERDGWNFKVIPKLIEVSGGSRNPGCAFSFLAEAAWGQTFLIVMTFFLLAVLIALFTVLPEKFVLLKISVSMIIAGAIGNLIDRIAYRSVRDFVELNMFGNMVACNFADFWIVIGTVIAVIDMLFINEFSVFPLTESAKRAQTEKQTAQLSEVKEAHTEAAEPQPESSAEPEIKTDGGQDKEE